MKDPDRFGQPVQTERTRLISLRKWWTLSQVVAIPEMENVNKVELKGKYTVGG